MNKCRFLFFVKYTFLTKAKCVTSFILVEKNNFREPLPSGLGRNASVVGVRDLLREENGAKVATDFA